MVYVQLNSNIVSLHFITMQGFLALLYIIVPL